MEHNPKLNPDSLEPLDLDATERRVVFIKARQNNVPNLTTMLGIVAMAAPGFLGTAAAMMGSPYKPPVQPGNERIAKLLAAEEKRQRRLERNKRNRPIRGCYDS